MKNIGILAVILMITGLLSCDGGSIQDFLASASTTRITNPTDGVQSPPAVDFAPASGNTWTIMIYLDADNDLESYGVGDFNEMVSGLNLLGDTIGQYLKVIVMIDRGSYSNSTIEGEDFSDTRYYSLNHSSVTRLDDGSAVAGHVANLGEKNMGDPATLKAFISYCKTNHASDHYALILWNHGGGSRSASYESPELKITNDTKTKSLYVSDLESEKRKAICWDETDSNDCLYLDEVQDSVNDYFNSGSKLDIIAFDACLMATIEVAYEFRSLADYMVGSMNTEYGGGWDYNRLFSGMTGSSSTGIELAKLMVKQYVDSTTSISSETQSAIDLSTLETLKTKVDALAVALKNENKQTTIESSRDDAFHFYSDDTESISYPYYDLGDLAYQIKANSNYSTGLQNAAQDVITQMESTVVSAYANNTFGNYYGSGTAVKRGLSIFFSRGNLSYNNGGGSLSHYAYQYWYTSTYVPTSYVSGYYYGNIDFCNSDSDGTVESWRELMEFYYDNPDAYTPSSY